MEWEKKLKTTGKGKGKGKGKTAHDDEFAVPASDSLAARVGQGTSVLRMLTYNRRKFTPDDCAAGSNTTRVADNQVVRPTGFARDSKHLEK